MFSVNADNLLSYQELESIQANTQIESSTTIVEPPNYSELFITDNTSSAITSGEQLVISKQPVTNYDQTESSSINLKDLKFNAFLRNSSNEKLVSSFGFSGDYMAYDDSVNCSPLTLCIKPTIKIASTNNRLDKHIFQNISSLPLKKINFNPDHSKIMLLFNNENKSELYLVNNDKSQQNYLDMNNADKITQLSCPIEYMLAASYDTNGNILVAGMKDNSLIIWTDASIHNDNIFKLKSSSIDDVDTFIENITFNNDGSSLYILSTQNISMPKKILTIFQKNSNWQQATEVNNIKTLPEDIDVFADIMVFYKNHTLTVRSLIDDTENSVEFKHNIVSVCFIPGTQDLLVCDDFKTLILLKYRINNKLSYHATETINLSYIINKFNFDTKDKNTLNIIASTYNINNNGGQYCFYGFIGAFLGTIGLSTSIASGALKVTTAAVVAKISAEAIAGPALSCCLFPCLISTIKDLIRATNIQKVDFKIKS